MRERIRSVNLHRQIRVLERRLEYVEEKLTVTKNARHFLLSEVIALKVAIECVEMVRGFAIANLINFNDLELSKIKEPADDSV